jgi:hypothetical protein
MNRLFWLSLTCLLVFISCKKSNLSNNLAEDNGCVERIRVSVTAHGIPAAEITIVNELFRTNGIDNSRFRYNQYRNDSFQTLYSPYTKYDEKIVGVDQYVNGLRLFRGDLAYIFWNDQLNHQSGALSNGTNLGTFPHLTTGQVRKLFLSDLEHFDNAGDKFKDSCFKAEFGYYNLNSGISYAAENLVKAWKLTPKYTDPGWGEYPIAFYQDGDGKLISYNNGIETFK